MSIEKKTYHGSFCWHGETLVSGTVATSKERAFGNMMFQLAKKLDKSVQSVTTYFKNKPDSYEIKEL